jgi:hypothetical protein
MIRQRVSTLLTTLSLVLSLFAVSVAVPASTMAALPNLTVGYGTQDHQITGSGASGAQPAAVTPGKYVAFSIWARNDDTSTISQFFITATTAGTVKSATWSKSDGSTQACTPGGDPLNCSFGQLKPGEWIDALIVFTTPASGTSMPVNFVWSTVGLGHGQTFPISDSVSLNGGANFEGTYVVDSGTVIVGDDPNVGPGNSRSTAAAVHNSGIPVTVQDGPNFNPPHSDICTVTATFACTGFFGEWSSINVENNHDFSPDTFTITITIDAASIPKGVNKNNIGIYHQYQDASGAWHEETVPLGCPGGSFPCFTLTVTKSLWVLVIQTTHNGNVRTF